MLDTITSWFSSVPDWALIVGAFVLFFFGSKLGIASGTIVNIIQWLRGKKPSPFVDDDDEDDDPPIDDDDDEDDEDEDDVTPAMDLIDLIEELIDAFGDSPHPKARAAVQALKEIPVCALCRDESSPDDDLQL